MSFVRAVSRRMKLNSIARAPVVSTQKRFLNLHEYQSRDLMQKYGVRVQDGHWASNPEETEAVCKNLVGKYKDEKIDLILKAQVHAGGRGKGHFDNGFKGGVKVCTDPAEVKAFSEKMFGAKLITKQTGAEGQLVSKVLVNKGIDFNKEFYFAILLDRAAGGPVMVASPQGGMDIEEVAASTPELIYSEPIDITKGVQPENTERIAKLLGFEGEAIKDAQAQMAGLYNLLVAEDATQVEINPMVTATDGKVYCVDAKINFDDNAEFRHKELHQQRDTNMEDPREVQASTHDLNYIGLDGNIGCMVNGAGLAMATMDIIAAHGASPANFLDVGGGANEKQVEEAFKLLNGDPKVEAILVNIFGGIMKCDVIAQGIVNAAKKLSLNIPLVVRLEGTNVEKGIKILNDSGIDLVSAVDLDDAAAKAVKSIAARA